MMWVLVYTDAALHNDDADPDEEASRQRRVSVSVLSMTRCYVWWMKTIWSMSGAEASASRDALDLAEEQFGAKS